jgi:hypothetical protein
MSESPSLMKRTIGALAGVAVDAARDLTVSQLDVMARGLHQRLSTTPASSEDAEQTDSIPDEKKMSPANISSVNISPATISPATIVPAMIAGALIGVGVALLISIKR